ncbi:1-acylglycerol-3-phosphate O-acyltransferase [Helicobacter saguini]|uniref:1-acyl-sn-glycerol-3-phosphate acyltransferase n=1 Tax=Helicobacter saguini TaxID=1548018 RepID=A0A347VRX7_9HELI|nr:lysophospholipid acyltransferase family protein [Helicobacter saguini]MWV62737.1 1-acylglycerol-3-phosphate O-acyltransferase [Helicobacter saguini]MWV66592.1 1-acylglycerol-3-phosphate O-acyltransferase [Helicobacter saguini]MWV68943.1 1-acylglycerol-3-phosphate O-acyltransferase [Helicobacter saguini]MWV71503.1 1-acylglycerol-3-phosphate O-acyltransferase [Helicobacter saguini]TLD92205.1 1-acyl-sn-glycerol-3-phosphate acyltransferase [Helicobacter saguini]
MLKKIRGYYAALSIALGLGFIILVMFFFKKQNNARKIRKWCRAFFPANHIKIDKFGDYDLSATLYVCNHQSATDIIYLEGYHPLNICWVAKKELGELPFYGYALKIPEMILIDRDDSRGLVQLLKEAKEKLAQGRPIVIFPEGTRGPGGKKFLPFKPGAKILAEKLKLKVQPIVFINMRKIFNGKPIECTSRHGAVIFLPSFYPSDLGEGWYDKLKENMFATYCEYYDKLNPNEDSNIESNAKI